MKGFVSYTVVLCCFIAYASSYPLIQQPMFVGQPGMFARQQPLMFARQQMVQPMMPTNPYFASSQGFMTGGHALAGAAQYNSLQRQDARLDYQSNVLERRQDVVDNRLEHTPDFDSRVYMQPGLQFTG